MANKPWAQTKGSQTLSYMAEAALEKGLIVIAGTADNSAALAVSGATPYQGVVTSLKTIASGEPVDVQNDGTAVVLVSGAIAVGDLVVAGAGGLGEVGTSGWVLGTAQEAVGAPAMGQKSYVTVKLEISNVSV